MRWAPLAAFACFLAAAAAWLGRDVSARARVFSPGSSLDPGPRGASLARAYLERIGRHPASLTVPLAQAALPPSTVLLRLDPGAQAAALATGEEVFVRSGGRLVLAVSGDRPSGAMAERGRRSGLRKVSPLLPGVRALLPEEPRSLPPAALVDAEPVFESGESVSIARRRLGRGEVWWVAEPELLLNDRLGDGDHLALLLALCAGRAPVFDEFSHGLEAGIGALDLLRGWGLGPALLLAALAALAGFWRRARTVGPPADPFADPRSGSVELVDSMASLYRRALAPAEALELYRRQLVREIALTLAVSEQRAARILAERVPAQPPAHGFREQLELLVSACERFRDEHRRNR